MSRLLIVSNRLPYTLRVEGRRFSFERSVGGLATGIAPFQERTGGLWFGWPGDTSKLTEDNRAAAEAWLTERHLRAIPLTADEVEDYYEAYSNGVLWPLFHYFPERVAIRVSGWQAYEAVNRRFAEAVASEYRPGDTVWVHDYQLMRVPALLRELIPEARIGFFLHIPFPTHELFRTLPQRSELLEGVLGADLVGFHTASYMRHFVSSATRLLGVSPEVDRLEWAGREVRLGVFPMGIDARSFAETATQREVVERAEELRTEGIQLLVGVDRLDYSKGIPRRLLALERLLEVHEELHGKVRLIQVAVPSREQVGSYRTFRRQTDELIGRINGRFGTLDWTPVSWVYRGIEREALVALYRAADVMLVTPVRDGMNLVAKEFAASRVDEDGVLVMSEFAGAAAELAEAVHVNPFDIEGSAEAYYRALTMPPEERRTRMRSLRRRVLASDTERWVARFLHALQDYVPPASGLTSRAELRQLVDRAREASDLVLLLDYDGSLVPFAGSPELARPDAPLLDLLARLAERPGARVHVVSGRGRDTLQRWLGDLPVSLHAEHGVWSRSVGSETWEGLPAETGEWRSWVRQILEEFAANTPGSLVEEKTLGLAWHYRSADPEYGAAQARELQAHLTQLLANTPVEVLPGSKVIEVRPHGLHKGLIVDRAIREAPPGVLAIALGDDRTDEDMFAALPDGNIAIHVGSGRTRANYRVATSSAARAFLDALVPSAAEARSAASAD